MKATEEEKDIARSIHRRLSLDGPNPSADLVIYVVSSRDIEPHCTEEKILNAYRKQLALEKQWSRK